MLKIKDLLSQSKTHRAVLISNSNIVGVSFAPSSYGKDSLGYYKSVKGTALTNQPGKKVKKIEIRLYYEEKSGFIPNANNLRPKNYSGPKSAPPFTIDSKAWVSCSCEYFLYHCEVADTKKDSSSIKYSNGAMPKVTNPRMIPHICKHLIAAIRKGALVKK